MDVLRRLYRRWLPVALGTAALVNLAVNVFVPAASQPVRFHDSGSLTDLVHTDSSSVDLRYGIYMEVADTMGGGTLVVPEESPLNVDLLQGLSGVVVEERDYDPSDLPSDLVSRGFPLGSFQFGDETLDYWIFPGGGVGQWWLAQDADGLVIVSESVAPLPGVAP